MRDFVWMVFSWYAISLLNSNTLEIFERKFLRRHNFAPLKEHDSFGNRILFSLLEQYKTHKGKKEKYYSLNRRAFGLLTDALFLKPTVYPLHSFPETNASLV